MANPAQPSDVEARWRPLSAAEWRTAEVLLGDAWQYLLPRVQRLEQRTTTIPPATAPDLDPATVTGVLATMVLRVMRNPDGKRQESIDDYSWTLDNARSGGLLYATEDELATLAPAPPLLGTAFVVSLSG